MGFLRSTFLLGLFKNAFKGPILKTIKCRTCAAFTATKETLFFTFWMVFVQRSKYNIHTDKWKNSCFSFLLLSGQFCGQTKVNLQNCVRFFPSICFYCNFSRILIGKKLVELVKLNIIKFVRIFSPLFLSKHFHQWWWECRTNFCSKLISGLHIPTFLDQKHMNKTI